MFKLAEKQKVYNIDGLKLGGQPGEYPIVMVGSIFYEGQKLIEDEEKGTFNEEEARELLAKEKEISETTGLPKITDVVGSTSKALIKHIDFVADETNAPFLIDGTTASVRIPAVKHVDEAGLSERAIYNTISVDCKNEEIQAIKEAEINSAVLLCFNPKSPTIEGRFKSLEKTLEIAQKANIENKLIDPSILDLPDPGPVSKMIFKIKEKYGLPSGCGAHNAVDMWRERSEMTSDEYSIRTAIANSLPVIMGADFALYGPMEDARNMYNACSLTEAYLTYSMRMEEGIRPKTTDHPLSKIFRS